MQAVGELGEGRDSAARIQKQVLHPAAQVVLLQGFPDLCLARRFAATVGDVVGLWQPAVQPVLGEHDAGLGAVEPHWDAEDGADAFGMFVASRQAHVDALRAEVLTKDVAQ